MTRILRKSIERKKRSENRSDIATSQIEQHSLLHQPSEPSWCDACAEGKTKKKAATRVLEEEPVDSPDDPVKEETWGVRLDVDLSGKTQPAMGKEVSALHQKDRETEYAGVEGPVNKEPETLRDAFNFFFCHGVAPVQLDGPAESRQWSS